MEKMDQFVKSAKSCSSRDIRYEHEKTFQSIYYTEVVCFVILSFIGYT
jgi:hypothetical protein